MEKLKEECMLSFYKELYTIKENDKSKVILVKNDLDDKLYIKKILRNYSKEVYLCIKDNPHINISKIYEVLELKDELIVIEEFINGFTLEEVLEKEILSMKIFEEYFSQICSALDYIHSISIIHRDIKPSNIMLTEEGRLKLIDFDSSRKFKFNFNKDTEILGTSGFASPEQYGFAQTDCRSDIYALGVLISYMLTGHHPKQADISGELEVIINKCLHMDPINRYQNIRDLENDIKRIYEQRDENIKKSSWVIPGFRTKKGWKMLIAIIGYFMIVYISVNQSPENSMDVLENISIFLILISIVFFYSNYRNINEALPMVNSKNILIKLAGYLIVTVFIFLFWVFICVIINEFI